MQANHLRAGAHGIHSWKTRFNEEKTPLGHFRASPFPVITGLDPKQDEAASQQAEKVGKLPGKPTDEAVKAIERILKPKKEEQQ